MTAYFWIGGTGNTSDVNHWSLSTGGVATTTTPGAGDEARFDANSGSGTATVDADLTVGAVTIDKAGFTVQVNAALNTTTASGGTGTVALKGGTLNVAHNCSWFAYNGAPTGATTRTLTLNASQVTLTSTTQPWLLTSTTNYTFNKGTSKLIFAGLGPSLISLGSLAYYDVQISNLASASVSIAGGGNTYHDLTVLGGSSGQGALQTQGLTCTGTFTATGQSATNRILIQSSASGNRRTYTLAAASASNVTFQDIGIAGAVGTLSGTNLDDAGGNAGISFDEPMNLYRVGAAGNWSDVSYWFTDDVITNDDGTTTPRTPRVPFAQDVVVVDERATGKITVDMPRLGSGLDLTRFAGEFATTSAVTVYGSVVLSNDPDFTITGAGSLVLGGRGTQLLTTSGKTIPQSVRLEAPGGVYNMQDNLVSTGALTMVFGTLDPKDHDVTIASFASSAGNNFRTLPMGSGTWTLTGTGTVWTITTNTAFTLDPGLATIVVSDTSGATKTFVGNGRTYRDFTFAGGSGPLAMGGSTFTGTVTYAPGSNVVLTSDTTTTVGELMLSGESGDLTTITASNPGVPATIRKNGGKVIADYLSLTDSVAAGTAQFYAGTHSVDGGGNLGWQFVAPPSGTNGVLMMLSGRL